MLEDGSVNNEIKQRKKTTPKGEKQTGRELSALNIHTRRKPTDQHRSTDTRRINRETNEGNDRDTGGTTETMIG